VAVLSVKTLAQSLALGDVDAVAKLLDRGLDPEFSWTRNPELIDLLVQYGFDPNRRMVSGDLPIEGSTKLGLTAVVAKLLHHGAIVTPDAAGLAAEGLSADGIKRWPGIQRLFNAQDAGDPPNLGEIVSAPELLGEAIQQVRVVGRDRVFVVAFDSVLVDWQRTATGNFAPVRWVDLGLNRILDIEPDRANPGTIIVSSGDQPPISVTMSSFAQQGTRASLSEGCPVQVISTTRWRQRIFRQGGEHQDNSAAYDAKTDAVLVLRTSDWIGDWEQHEIVRMRADGESERVWINEQPSLSGAQLVVSASGELAAIYYMRAVEAGRRLEHRLAVVSLDRCERLYDVLVGVGPIARSPVRTLAAVERGFVVVFEGKLALFGPAGRSEPVDFPVSHTNVVDGAEGLLAIGTETGLICVDAHKI